MSPRKRIKQLTSDIERIENKAEDIWWNRTKFSVKHEDRLRLKMHALDSLSASLYHVLWRLHQETKFQYADDLDEIERRKVFNGVKDVTHITYCDGIFHFITGLRGKKGKLRYGRQCNC